MIDITEGGDSPEMPEEPPTGSDSELRIKLLNPEMLPAGAQLPELIRLTHDCEGIGGRIKDEPEDFVVEEIPLYEPCGQGDHLFLWIQKRDLSHERLVEHLGRTLNISRHDVGSAGMKDRRAVTRQWVSVPARCIDRIGQLETDHVHVLDAARHTNSLKTGHCLGNRFSITVNDVVEDAEARVQKTLSSLGPFGFPNYYGLQRFGLDGETLSIGYQLLTGEKKPTSIPKGRRKFLVRLGLSALQSAIFNDVVADRIGRGLFREVMAGDVMTFPTSRTVFEVEDVSVEQQRLEAGETLITGPMIGVKMRGPNGLPEELERNAVEARGLRVGQFANWKSTAPGSRRPMAVRPDFHEIRAEENRLIVDMTLPRGSFATVVLSELMDV